MTRIKNALVGVTRLAIDTAPIIYFIESHPDYDSLVTEVFRFVSEGVVTGVTSVISLAEVLTRPLREGQTQLYLQYRTFLLNADHLEMVSIDPDIAERASLLRAQYGLRTPDALQIAAAIHTPAARPS